MLQYYISPQLSDELSGADLIGYVQTTYDQLVKLFNHPLAGDKQYIDAQWHIKLENNHVVCISNFKDGKSFLGDDGKDVHDITTWRVDGHYENDFQDVKKIIVGDTVEMFEARLLFKNKDDLMKRLQTILLHIDEGRTKSESSSDWHSWQISEIKQKTPDIEQK